MMVTHMLLKHAEQLKEEETVVLGDSWGVVAMRDGGPGIYIRVCSQDRPSFMFYIPTTVSDIEAILASAKKLMS